MKNQQKNCQKRTSIGGQAVMEGVMMRGRTAMATAVRDADGIIRLETKRLTPPEKQNKFLRLPFIRGSVNLVSSMITGSKTLMRSADVYGEGEPGKFEKWLAKKCKINLMSVVTTISLILGLALAILLFIVAPQGARRLIEIIIGNGFTFGILAKNLIEGAFKILIFIFYLLLVSLIKDIRRTFMYHGAEHKTISCYEKGLELTVENARKCTRVHDRCGTTFMFFVIFISIVVFALVEGIFGAYSIQIEKIWRVLLKIALLPIVSGISYELLKLLSKTKSKIVLPLKAPGLLLQRITTREPSDDMLEVAITAFNKVMEMDADQSIGEVSFIIPEKRIDVTERVIAKLNEAGITETAEAEWIVSIKAGIKRSEVYTDNLISAKNVEEINRAVNDRVLGRPLWYIIGDTDFYGYTIKVDERVLIPRPETEVMVENALKIISKETKVLDLCCGSGAIAIAVKGKTGAVVTASDISEEALSLAKENALQNQMDITFIKSDLFENIDEKFDVIITNPPYIKSQEINGLQKEVKNFEPILALDGGNDGLDYYRRIAKEYKNYLNDGGVLFAEFGCGQEKELMEIFGESAQIIKDLEGIDRILKVN